MDVLYTNKDKKPLYTLRIYHQADGACCLVEKLTLADERVLHFYQFDLLDDQTWKMTIDAPINHGDSLVHAYARLQQAAAAIPESLVPAPAHPAEGDAAEGDATDDHDDEDDDASSIPTTEDEEPQSASAPAHKSEPDPEQKPAAAPVNAPEPAPEPFDSYNWSALSDDDVAKLEALGLVAPLLTAADTAPAAAPAQAEGEMDEGDAFFDFV